MAIVQRKLPDMTCSQPLLGNGMEADLREIIAHEKLRNPCLLELIWLYWQEEGTQVLARAMHDLASDFGMRVPTSHADLAL